MGNLLLNEMEMSNLKAIVGVNTVCDITMKDFVSESGCDRYDCFFRGTQCTCEGTCDGKQ